MLESRFESLVTTIIYGLCEMDPVQATYLGVHNFDSLLPRTDARSRQRYLEQLHHLNDVLAEFDERGNEMSENGQIDLALIQAIIKHGILLENQDYWRRNPSLYSENLLFGLYLLMIRTDLEPDQQLESLVGRMTDAVRLLSEATDNLQDASQIPHQWVATALGQIGAGRQFISDLEEKLKAEFPARVSEISEAVQVCRQALVRFEKHLGSIRENCVGEFACGPAVFSQILKDHHMLDDTPEELRAYGEQLIEETMMAMEEVTAELDEYKSSSEAIAALKQEHPSAENLVGTYAEAMQAAREFVIEKKIAPVPTDQELRVEATPEFQRSTIPYAAYVPPPPFSGSQIGLFWVTPPAEDADDDARAQLLQDHSKWGIPITALHEGFPGHHLQLCHANRQASQVRRFFMTSVFVEGWALYCEEMMGELGFYQDAQTRLMQLKDQLWRACRVVIDVGLHCQGMTTKEAEDMLVEVAGLDAANARAEVTRYTSSPTQPMSYLVGKREMLRLKEDWTAARPDADLLEFHDAVIRQGSLPFRLIRKALGLEG